MTRPHTSGGFHRDHERKELRRDVRRACRRSWTWVKGRNFGSITGRTSRRGITRGATGEKASRWGITRGADHYLYGVRKAGKMCVI